MNDLYRESLWLADPGGRRSASSKTAWATALGLISLCSVTSAAVPDPVVEIRFEEGSGLTTANAGALGGQGDFVQTDEFPLFVSQVPTGPMTPKGNQSAVDFGTIAEGQGGRAIDFNVGPDGTLGALSAFTATGWLNPRDLGIGWGGNRLLFALAEPNGPGFDLVQLDNGALRLGVNQWPDGANGGGPSSSSGKLKADAQTGASNWVFFAVTYDPSLDTGNVKYFFGAPDQLAQLDSAHTYKGGTPENGGLIESSGALSLGNFGTVAGARTETGPGGGSRVFRGLMDEVKVYNQALGLADIQRAQLNGEPPPVPVSITQQPVSQTVFAGQRTTFRVQASGAAPLTYQWQKNGSNIPNATEPSYTIPAVTLSDTGAQFRVTVTNPSGTLQSDTVTLTVLEESGHKVSASFSEGSLTVMNRGNLGGIGTFAPRDGFPVSSTNVPSGAFAPADNLASVDFGSILEGQGGRAIDFTNAFGGTLGSMDAFTVAGWVNATDLLAGWGGNRLVFALAEPAGPGFDVVQLADGSVQLGVNQWPDGSPATSSPGKITESADASAENWVFFAVTYDGTQPSGNVNFYFGKPNQAAELDLTADYDRGPILRSGSLTIGNFGAVAGARNETGPTGGSRVFRGLIDEINVFSKALTLDEIISVQKAPAQASAVTPKLTVSKKAGDLVLQWEAAANATLQASDSLATSAWSTVNVSPVVSGAHATVTVPITGAAQFFRLQVP